MEKSSSKFMEWIKTKRICVIYLVVRETHHLIKQFFLPFAQHFFSSHHAWHEKYIMWFISIFHCLWYPFPSQELYPRDCHGSGISTFTPAWQLPRTHLLCLLILFYISDQNPVNSDYLILIRWNSVIYKFFTLLRDLSL